jgi:hypothetical protein
MTRKDFVLIAQTIQLERQRSRQYVEVNNCRTCVELDHLDQITESFADALATTNPRFNRSRFINACSGKNGGCHV